MIQTKDIAWLAGFLEGEGTFGRYRNCLTIRAESTDKDVIHRVAKLLDVPVYASTYTSDKNIKWKPTWRFSIHGNRAAGWMMTLYPLLGERRKDKIREIIVVLRKAETITRKPRLTSHYGGE